MDSTGPSLRRPWFLAAWGVVGCLAMAVVGVLILGAVVVGFVAVWVAEIRPWMAQRAAAAWTPTPCRILALAIAERQGDNGDLVRLTVEYEYEAAGGRRVSHGYDPLSPSGDRAWCSGEEFGELSKAHATRGPRTCLVNPANPDDAVLVTSARRPGASGWSILVFCLGMSVAGVFGLFAVVDFFARTEARWLARWEARRTS